MGSPRFAREVPKFVHRGCGSGAFGEKAVDQCRRAFGFLLRRGDSLLLCRPPLPYRNWLCRCWHGPAWLKEETGTGVVSQLHHMIAMQELLAKGIREYKEGSI